MQPMAREHEVAGSVEDRLCYYCNEGRCALCNGWDRTVISGQIVTVPCAHDCHTQAGRKPNQRTIDDAERMKRPNRA